MMRTVFPTFKFPMPPRAALALLGQIAAPLQVLWLQAQILRDLQLHHWGDTSVDPLVAIGFFQQALCEHAFTQWITRSHYIPRSITLQYQDLEKPFEVHIQQPLMVNHLRQAEKQMAGWGHYVVVTKEDQRVPDAELLQPGVVYKVCHVPRKQARPFPTDDILAGGPGEQDLLLGDRVLWVIMKEIAHHNL